MDGIKVLQLAEMIGLRQSVIAHHFEVTRVQVNRWAHGNRPIPVRYRDDLMRLLYDAVVKFLGPHHAWYLKQAAGDVSASTYMTLAEFKYDSERHHIAKLFYELFLAHMAEIGKGPTVNLAVLIKTVAAYDSMDIEALHKVEHLHTLAELGRRIMVNAALEIQFGPLLSLVEQGISATPSTTATPEQ